MKKFIWLVHASCLLHVHFMLELDSNCQLVTVHVRNLCCVYEDQFLCIPKGIAVRYKVNSVGESTHPYQTASVTATSFEQPFIFFVHPNFLSLLQSPSRDIVSNAFVKSMNATCSSIFCFVHFSRIGRRLNIIPMVPLLFHKPHRVSAACLH